MLAASRLSFLRQSLSSFSSSTSPLLRFAATRHVATSSHQWTDGQIWSTIRAHVQLPKNTPPESLEKQWASRSRDALDEMALHPPANPYSGRSVQVRGGDVADAYKRLEGILARNKVRAQLRLAERHEKPGNKRRRLSSERWRKQFANEVRKKVQLVMKIRNRGA